MSSLGARCARPEPFRHPRFLIRDPTFASPLPPSVNGVQLRELDFTFCARPSSSPLRRPPHPSTREVVADRWTSPQASLLIVLVGPHFYFMPEGSTSVEGRSNPQ